MVSVRMKCLNNTVKEYSESAQNAFKAKICILSPGKPKLTELYSFWSKTSNLIDRQGTYKMIESMCLPR